MRRAQTGRSCEPPGWFEPYFRARYPDLLRVALATGGVHHLQEADDAIQSVMVKQVAAGCWEHIEEPHSYFSKAVIRAALMMHRSRARHPELALPDAGNDILGSAPGAGFTVWKDTQWVLGLLKELPIEQRKVMALILDGLTGVEVAELLGASEATVRSNLRHARDRLTKLLTDPPPGYQPGSPRRQDGTK